MVWDATQPAAKPAPPAALPKYGDTTKTGMSSFFSFEWGTSTQASVAEEWQLKSAAIEAVDSGVSRNDEAKSEVSDQRQEIPREVRVTNDKAEEVEVEIQEVAPSELKKMSFSEEAADHLRNELANYLMKQTRKGTENGRDSKKSKEKKRSELKKYLKRTLKTYLDERSNNEVVSKEQKESLQDLRMCEIIDDTVSRNAETEVRSKSVAERTLTKEAPKESTKATTEVDGKNPKYMANKETLQEPVSEVTKGEATEEASEAVPMEATEETWETSTETLRDLDKSEALSAREKKAKEQDAKEVAKKVKARLATMEKKVREAATKAAKEKKAKQAGEKKHRRKDSFVLLQRKSSLSLHGKSKTKPKSDGDTITACASVSKSSAVEGKPRSPLRSDTGVSKLTSGLEILIQSEYQRLEEINHCMEEEKKRTAKKLEVEKKSRQARHKEAMERFEIKKQIIREQREEREAQLKLEFEREMAIKEASKEAARHTAALNKALEDFKKLDQRCNHSQAMEGKSQGSEKNSKSFTKGPDQEEENWKAETQDAHFSGDTGAGGVVCLRQQQLQGEIVDEREKQEALQDNFIEKVQKSPKFEGSAISDLLQAPKLARGESLRSLKSETSLFDGSSILKSDLFNSPKVVSSSILRSDLFSKRILSGPLKSKKSKEAESLIEKELWRLRKEQSELFAKGRNLTSELSDISEQQSKLDFI